MPGEGPAYKEDQMLLRHKFKIQTYKYLYSYSVLKTVGQNVEGCYCSCIVLRYLETSYSQTINIFRRLFICICIWIPPSMLRRRNPTLRKLRGSEVYWRQPTSATSVATRHRYLGCTPVRVTIYLERIFGTTSRASKGDGLVCQEFSQHWSLDAFNLPGNIHSVWAYVEYLAGFAGH